MTKSQVSLKKSLLKKTARNLIKLRLSSLFRIRQKGFVLKFYPSSMSRKLWVGQYLSESYREEQEFFRHYLRPDDGVIDVGANIGFFTLIFSTLVGKYGKVYAFEPHPRIYRYLQGNLALNRAENVYAFNIALGAERCTVNISNRKGDDRNSVIKTGIGITVLQKRLDELGIEDEPIALLKIDVEGYENFVIEGAGQALKNVQCIYFEAVERHFLKFGYNLGDLLNILISQGFQILRIEGDKVWSVLPNSYRKMSKNLVAVREIQPFLNRTSFEFSSEIS